MCVLVEITGLEPVASSTPRKRATICAISRNKAGWKLLPASRAQLRSFSMCSYEIVCVMLVRVERLELSASWSQITRSSQTELHPDKNEEAFSTNLNYRAHVRIWTEVSSSWCSRLGSNQWPHDYQSCTLTIWATGAYSRQVIFLILTGIEPVSFSWKENVITNRL